MDTETGTTAGAVDLEAQLREQAPSLDVLQLLRRLEIAHRQRPRWGQARRPADEPLRLGQEPELSFPSSPIARYEPASLGDNRPARLLVRFFGLLGPNGPLPLHYTEYAWERQRHANDPTFARFLDLFHHRLLTLFYRAWANSQPVIERDRPDEDRFAGYVAALVGLGRPALRARMALPDLALLHHAGRFTPQVRNAEGLAALVNSQFGVQARVEEFVGTWVAIPSEVRWRLGGGPGAERLGVATTAGASAWSVQNKFRLVLGPLGERQFTDLLPGGPMLRRLRDLVRAYVGLALAWDVKLVLTSGIDRPARLGVSRLGWTTWLGRRTSDGRHDVIVDADAVAARTSSAAA